MISCSQKKGYGNLGTSLKVIPTLQFNVIAARRSWAAANRDVILRYVRAFDTAYRYMSDPKNRRAPVNVRQARVTGWCRHRGKGSGPELDGAVMPLGIPTFLTNTPLPDLMLAWLPAFSVKRRMPMAPVGAQPCPRPTPFQKFSWACLEANHYIRLVHA